MQIIHAAPDANTVPEMPFWGATKLSYLASGTDLAYCLLKLKESSMLAVPVDNALPGLKSSKLFGNAPMFAIYSPDIKQFFVVENGGVGDGMNTAEFLKKQGVDSVAYTHLGEGLYKALESDGIDVYYLGKDPLYIYQVIDGVAQGQFVKVLQSNAAAYLDPGMPSGSCECGGSHD